MSQVDNPYAAFGYTAAQAPASERTAFLKRTYIHLGMAAYAFAALEYALFQVVPEQTMQSLVGWMISGWSWLIVLGLFMFVGWIAESWARSDTSPAMQYAGLFLYVAAEAVIFLPILYIALRFFPDQNIIGTAAVITLVMFGGLTASVLMTGADFSFLGTGLRVAGFAIMGLILCFIFVPGFGALGTIFTVAMIVFAGAYILYYTSNVLHHYRTDQHVSASLALFASVALLFWYVLQLFLSRD